MPESGDWILYGANGYTGRLIAEEAVRRAVRPVLAGRNAKKIQALARQLDCPSRVFDMANVDRIAKNLSGCRAVLHCAGPFSRTAEPMIQACLKSGVHYLDITGEIAAIQLAASRHVPAADAGVTLMPAVGMDVVPSDCLAAKLARRLPNACLLELAFSSAGSISPGTATTILEALPQRGRVRIDGTITKVPSAWKIIQVPFRHGVRPAVTVPWGDVASAWHTTGIPNIQTYLAMTPRQIKFLRFIRYFFPLFRFPFSKGPIRWAIRRFLAGPSPEQRRRGHVSFWGRVADADGNSVQATLETPSSYSLTVEVAIASLEKVLAGDAPAGFCTPAKAFGSDFILTVPGTDFRWAGL